MLDVLASRFVQRAGPLYGDHDTLLIAGCEPMSPTPAFEDDDRADWNVLNEGHLSTGS